MANLEPQISSYCKSVIFGEPLGLEREILRPEISPYKSDNSIALDRDNRWLDFFFLLGKRHDDHQEGKNSF